MYPATGGIYRTYFWGKFKSDPGWTAIQSEMAQENR